MAQGSWVNQYKESWPIWKLEVRWERWLSGQYSDSEAWRRMRVVYSLLELYPTKKYPKDFLTPDIEDWKIVRGREVKPITLVKDVWMLHQFFNWLIGETDSAIQINPVCLEAKVRSVPAMPDLSLRQLQHLWRAAILPVDRRMLSAVLQCESTREAAGQLGRSVSWMSKRYRHLRELASFPPEIKLRNLRKCFAKLALRLGERAVLALLAEQGTLDKTDALPCATSRETSPCSSELSPTVPC